MQDIRYTTRGSRVTFSQVTYPFIVHSIQHIIPFYITKKNPVFQLWIESWLLASRPNALSSNLPLPLFLPLSLKERVCHWTPLVRVSGYLCVGDACTMAYQRGQKSLNAPSNLSQKTTKGILVGICCKVDNSCLLKMTSSYTSRFDLHCGQIWRSLQLDCPKQYFVY